MTVTIYSTPSCSFCTQAKKYLKGLNVKVKDIDISSNPAKAEELYRKTRQRGVPVIVIKGSTIVGFDKNRIDRILNIS